MSAQSFRPDRHQPRRGEEVQVPAAKVPITGLRAEGQVIRHAAKMQKLPFDAGMDLYPTIIDKVTHHGHVAQIWVCTGISVHVAPGFVGYVRPRSSSIDRLNGGEPLEGIIDAGYQGEIMLRVRVPNHEGIIESVSMSIKECIANNIAIAQFILQQVIVVVPFVPSDPMPPTSRGASGFGSTDNIGGKV